MDVHMLAEMPNMQAMLCWPCTEQHAAAHKAVSRLWEVAHVLGL